MRLLIITFDPPENIGGVEGRARHYTEQLIKEGHFVELISVSQADEPSVTKFFGADLLRYPSSVRAVPFVFRKIRNEISNKSIDSLFLLSGGLSLLGNLLLLHARLKGIIPVIFIYGKDILTIRTRSWPLRLPLFFAPRLAKGIAANSHYTEGLLPTKFHTKIDILYPAVDPSIVESVSSIPKTSSTKTVLFVGRLVERKGVDVLMRSFSDCLPEIPDANLEIVGDGPEFDKLLQLSRSLRLNGRVRFTGKLIGTELFNRYSNSDVFVMPSRAIKGDVEGFGTVFLEAALFGKPSIGTRSGGIPEAIVDGETGLLVPEGDNVALESALKSILLDTSLRKHLGENARKRVLEKFTWKNSADCLVEIIQKAAHKRDQVLT